MEQAEKLIIFESSTNYPKTYRASFGQIDGRILSLDKLIVIYWSHPYDVLYVFNSASRADVNSFIQNNVSYVQPYISS